MYLYLNCWCFYKIRKSMDLYHGFFSWNRGTRCFGHQLWRNCWTGLGFEGFEPGIEVESHVSYLKASGLMQGLLVSLWVCYYLFNLMAEYYWKLTSEYCCLSCCSGSSKSLNSRETSCLERRMPESHSSIVGCSAQSPANSLQAHSCQVSFG